VFVFISHLTVPPEDHDELERHFRERSGLVDSFPGFLYLQLLAPQGGTATHTFLTAWESRDAFRRYMQSQEHAVSHSREPGEIMRRTQVRHEAYDTRVCVSARDPRVRIRVRGSRQRARYSGPHSGQDLEALSYASSTCGERRCRRRYRRRSRDRQTARGDAGRHSVGRIGRREGRNVPLFVAEAGRLAARRRCCGGR